MNNIDDNNDINSIDDINDMNNIITLATISETNSDNSIYDNKKLGGYTAVNATFLRKNKYYDIQFKFNNILRRI